MITATIGAATHSVAVPVSPAAQRDTLARSGSEATALASAAVLILLLGCALVGMRRPRSGS